MLDVGEGPTMVDEMDLSRCFWLFCCCCCCCCLVGFDDGRNVFAGVAVPVQTVLYDAVRYYVLQCFIFTLLFTFTS